MAFNLHGKSLISVKYWTNREVKHVLNSAKVLKEQMYTGTPQNVMGHTKKNIAVIMQKDSTRTRSSFEVGAFQLGMNTTYIGGTGSQMGKKESIEDTAKVLGEFYDGIAFRGSATEDVEMLAKHAGVPVWNALSDDFHPTQMFADYLTIQEEFGRTDIRFSYVGDARSNMGNSLMLMAAHMGAEFWAVAPKELWPEQSLVDDAKKIAELTGASINITDDIDKGVKGSHVLYTDVWVSMGEPDSVWEERISLLKPYQIDAKMMAKADKKAIFMHCLPGFHDTNTIVGKQIEEKFGITSMECSDEVFRAPYSRVMEQAGNRMHTIKAIMLETIGY